MKNRFPRALVCGLFLLTLSTTSSVAASESLTPSKAQVKSDLKAAVSDVSDDYGDPEPKIKIYVRRHGPGDWEFGVEVGIAARKPEVNKSRLQKELKTAVSRVIRGYEESRPIKIHCWYKGGSWHCEVTGLLHSQ